MRTRNLWIILLALLLVTVLALSLVACKKTPEPSGGDPSGENGQTTDPVNPDPGSTEVSNDLPVPANLKAANGKATWDRPSGGGYTFELEINGDVINRGTAVNYILTDYANRPADGKFALRVRALKDGKAGAWSAVVNYTYEGADLLTPEVRGMEGTMLKWSAVSDAICPVVTVGGVEHALSPSATSYDLAGLTEETDVSLYYKGDGVYKRNSATLRYVYTPSTKKLAFASPTHVYMEGEVLHFDRVEGANVYYFRDVKNTTTISTIEEINSLSSDRAGHYLVRSVVAGNTDLDIADSRPADVTYFAQGKGTEDSPYEISNIGELRYIEYYEATNQSCYYRLVTDIDFPEYSPKEDEKYSNFYNLGSLSGVLDGGNHVLRNIVVYDADGYSSIFDNITESGVIKNLSIENSRWRTWTIRTNDGHMQEKGGECAILAYTNRGTIENVSFVSGSIYAKRDGAAGLVSINRAGAVIRDCRVMEGATIYGANESGGIAIYNAGTVTDCRNEGTVSGDTVVGGIVGRNAGTVTRCMNAGTVVGNTVVGGIVGYNYNIKDVDDHMQYATVVSLSVNRGVVTGGYAVGGIAGRNGSTGVNELAESNRYGNAGVYACYHYGDVVGALSVGGLVGENNGYYDAANHFGVYASYSSGVVQSIALGANAKGKLVYFTNTQGWGTVYAYAWNDNTKKNMGAWPGNTCVKAYTNGLGQDVYGAVLTEDCDRIIFHNGADGKSADITVTNGKGYYVTDGGVGEFDPTGGTDWANKYVGYLTGYNNMVNYCYYANPLGALQTDATVGGNANPDDVLAMNADTSKQAVADFLNLHAGEDVFISVDNAYPVLKWEQGK